MMIKTLTVLLMPFIFGIFIMLKGIKDSEISTFNFFLIIIGFAFTQPLLNFLRWIIQTLLGGA